MANFRPWRALRGSRGPIYDLRGVLGNKVFEKRLFSLLGWGPLDPIVAHFTPVARALAAPLVLNAHNMLGQKPGMLGLNKTAPTFARDASAFHHVGMKAY